MTSYLFVVRVPIEKDLPKENEKEKVASDPGKSESSEPSPKPKDTLLNETDKSSLPSPNAGSSVSEREILQPDPKPESTLKETKDEPDVSVSVSNGENPKDKSEEDDPGNRPEKTDTETDFVDVEWDFGDEATDTDKNLTTDGVADKSEEGGSRNKLDTITPDADVDVEWDLGGGTTEVTDTDENVTHDTERLLSGKIDEPNDKEEDKISLSRFTVEPSPELDTIDSGGERDEPFLKPSASRESVNSKKFVVETVTTPVLEEPNENKLSAGCDKDSLGFVTVDEKLEIEKTCVTPSETSVSGDKPADKNKLDVTVTGILKSSSAAKLDEEEKKAEVVFFIPKEPLLKVVLNIVEDFGIDNVTTSETENKECHQIIFVDEGGEKCENILNKLSDAGIGNKVQTSISIYQSTIFRGTKGDQSEEDLDDDNEDEEENAKKESEFKKSIKARMLVTEVVDSVRSNAEFTFDYLLLVILASLISGLGLVENSSVVLVASMLISPLMGPILAGTFGAVIKNDSLRNLGLKSESLGLFICMFSGFCFGLISGGVSLNGARWGSTDMWPTNEMMSRGTLRSLWVGMLIALPSGAGVALSVLGGNTGSLVGVAISASLLPPAVNAGMLWAYALLAGIMPPPTVPFSNQNTTLNNTILNTRCPSFVDNTYVPVYNCNMATEAAFLGLVSLSLTLINIFCIIVVAIIVLKIKEVAPQASVSDETRKFWAEDIQIARESYATSKGPQSLTLAQQAKELMDQWRLEKGDEPLHTLQLKQMIEEVENSEGVKEILGKLSFKSKPFSSSLNKDFRRAEEDFTMSFISDHRMFNDREVYNTFHGRPGSAIVLSPTGFLPRRANSLNRRKPKTATLNTIDETGSIVLGSNLYNRRKKSRTLSEGDDTSLRGDKDPLIEDTRM